MADKYLDFASFTTAQHLSEIEPQITSVLIENGIFVRISCSNVETGKLRRMYRV